MTRTNLRAPAGAAELVELDRDACLCLLAGGGVGRVVFTEAAMPAARPVSYVLDGEEVLFRVADAQFFHALHHAVIGFQADEIDRPSRTGWSVLGVGHAYEVQDPVRLASVGDALPEPWAPHVGSRIVAVPLQHLTGRRLR